MRTNLSWLTLAFLTFASSASFAQVAAVDDVCAEGGSPPASFPSCAWSIPVEGGEVLLDTVGIASAEEVRAALAEGRDPTLSHHVLTDEEGAWVVEGVVHAMSAFSGVVLDDLPTHGLRDHEGPVTVIAGKVVVHRMLGGRVVIFGWDDGGYTILFRVPGLPPFFYDSHTGWSW
ncbi:hypothetical protein [Myxococcus landrumensis]|uniref:Lipoprotein n=1 Tax=Myxococcus landrumensis TaxID=2813577 RepID=A0ABX7N3G1_9BACT|nr:hypothetical protein [Myxococcus landrumus]QSQ13173.1 hypothetical protein JY572_33275 [Myxococcus landrumus]